MKQKIVVTVGTDGDTQVQVEGVKGKTCKDLTRDMERALGTVVETKETNEYREREQLHHQSRN